MSTVTVEGSDPIDQNTRLKNLIIINELPTELLQKLGELAGNEKAQSQLKNNFQMIKSFIM